MSVRTRKLPSGKVRVSTPGGVKAKATTPAKAQRQANLLRAVDKGWEPTGKPPRDVRSRSSKKPSPSKGSRKGR